MNKKSRQILIYIIVSLSCVLIIISPLIILHYSLPQKIRLIEGKEHSFEFVLPFEAKIIPQKQGVLKINNEPIKDNNIKIKLNKPFTMQADNQGIMNIQFSLFGVIPVRSTKVDVLPYHQVIPGGHTIGVRIATDGILVLGTGAVKVEDGKDYEPGRNILQTGDLILEVNGEKLNCKEDLIDSIHKEPLLLKVRRGNSVFYHTIVPVYSKDENTYKIGVWVRDSTQGIGTITYYNPDNKVYGALGHGITDVDTKQMMSVKEGNLIKTQITSIRKGRKGSPGELGGIIVENKESIIGNVSNNTEKGIYGKLNDEGVNMLGHEPVYIAFQDEVEEGEAVILSNITGDRVEEFKVNIQKISRYNSDTSKGMIVKIVDERLIDATSGIVQGMSGSPILQNNKLIGAITHVFVQDPTKGYGIFIENMFEEEKQEIKQ